MRSAGVCTGSADDRYLYESDVVDCCWHTVVFSRISGDERATFA